MKHSAKAVLLFTGIFLSAYTFASDSFEELERDMVKWGGSAGHYARRSNPIPQQELPYTQRKEFSSSERIAFGFTKFQERTSEAYENVKTYFNNLFKAKPGQAHADALKRGTIDPENVLWTENFDTKFMSNHFQGAVRSPAPLHPEEYDAKISFGRESENTGRRVVMLQWLENEIIVPLNIINKYGPVLYLPDPKDPKGEPKPFVLVKNKNNELILAPSSSLSRLGAFVPVGQNIMQESTSGH